jgi:hypothetical protein
MRPNLDLHAPEWLAVRPEHYLEISKYDRSFKPAGKRGKPKQTKPAKPTRQLDPELALLVYQLAADGLHWKDIARRVYPDRSVADRSSEAMRKRIEHLIFRGETLAMER